MRIMQKRILVIDGGGIKGVFPASFLSQIEKQIGDKVGNYFDLIVGTSTGGILALGLGMGYSANDLLEFYKKHGKSIFGGNAILKSIRSVFFSKYNQKALKHALVETFGEKQLGESKNRLVIPSLNLSTGNVHIYKTAHHERFTTDYVCPVVDVALSTSAAPTYFPAHLLPSGSPLIDGGVWANNPIGIAVAESIGILKWPAESLQILSIGCTSTPTGKRKLSLGKAYWALRVADLFMRAQSSASLGIAAVLTSHEQIIRIEPMVSAGRYELDNYKAIPSLEGLGETYARESMPKVKFLFQESAEAFKPFYSTKK